MRDDVHPCGKPVKRARWWAPSELWIVYAFWGVLIGGGIVAVVALVTNDAAWWQRIYR